MVGAFQVVWKKYKSKISTPERTVTTSPPYGGAAMTERWQ
jgi:hypothetical protein